MGAASRLPAAVRAWGWLGRAAGPRRRLEVAGALGRRWLQSGRAYVTAGGFVARLDAADPFQVAMAIGLFDRWTLAVIDRHVRPGATVIEGGAHLGFLTARLARAVGDTGSVHAFEPDPRLFPRLLGHIEGNGLRQVRADPRGLLDRPLADHALGLPDQLGWASVIPGEGHAAASAPVAMTTVDDYVAEQRLDPRAIALIKLDVEGAELRALRGAATTLSATRAAVLVEYIPERMRRAGEDPRTLVEAMADHGYAPWVPVARAGRYALTPGLDGGAGDDVLFLKGGR